MNTDVIDYQEMINQALADSEMIETGINLSEEDLLSVTVLADRMMKLEDLVYVIESKLKEANESLRKVREQFLPDAMISANVKGLQLNDGSKLTRAIKYIGSITKNNEEDAFNWFKETNREGVVTSNISLPVGKGKMEEAKLKARKLETLGYEVELKHSIHWAALRAVVRELYENGEKVPPSISTYIINEASIKRVK